MLEEVKAEIETRHMLIKDHMEALGVEEMIHGGYKVTWKPVHFIAVSTKMLEKRYPQIYAELGRPVDTMRFKIAAAPLDAAH